MKFIASCAAIGLLMSAAAFAQTSPAPQQAMFATVAPGDQLSSVVIGLDIYNNANQDIGTIKDIAYSGGDVKAYIVAVGGVLGVGGQYVAVSPSDLKIAYDGTAKKWHANMDTTVEKLKAGPALDYPPKA